MPESIPVTFEPSGVTVWVSPGTTVLEASIKAGIVVPAPCGGRGICGSCGVKVRSGELESPDAEEAAGLVRAPMGVRLACRARVVSPVAIRPIIAHPRAQTRVPEGECVPLAAGVDLGTTNVAAALIDKRSGREIGRASVPNRQQAWGADVVSRIDAAAGGAGEALRQAADESIADALRAAAAAAGVPLRGVEDLVIVGNTTLSASLLGADLSSLGAFPYTPPYAETSGLPAASATRALISPDASPQVLPPVAGFVGADALAGAYIHGLLGQAGRNNSRLLVDVGTNAELVLRAGDRLIVSSAAAGPAFEGVGISCGGLASPGAVERVEFGTDGRPALTVIGGAEPTHFAGSGLLSALVAMREDGVLAADGALRECAECGIAVAADVTGLLHARFRSRDVACPEIMQTDIRSLQLAMGAVRAGIEIVLAEAGVSAQQVGEVLVAGAFGRATLPSDLIAVGMLPAAFAGRVTAVGNSALDGAVAAALGPEALGAIAGAAASAEALDLAAKPEFQATLLASMRLEAH